ncbi:MAG: excinuclease ABC subunit B [Candidatus Anoxymicrobium japonicum]|uniref:UvrABC system protein B n=1 Tax=Candidatus Anoxymicrobium japonicum TaxID=2013648 RepID=A0A2N3G611_9ACTN|nr:MAG: excinuclease ABC subunit B [Candidatus Anoxymicrobium japonicum]
MPKLKLETRFIPQGDQPSAIAGILEGFERQEDRQVLMGVTGSGKTFTMACVIEALQMPTLVLSPNKTLAAQLYSEFREFFPNNAVEYFVSYYDYYQPEAYIPSTDTFIEKDSSINEEIDRLRHGATSALLSRPDVIIVASVSCIYGLGSPEEYLNRMVMLEVGKDYERDDILRRLVDIRYERNDLAPARGKFRVRGDVIDIYPAYWEKAAVRVELLGDTVERITQVDPVAGNVMAELDRTVVWPATHFLTPSDKLQKAVRGIEEELEERLVALNARGKLLEAQRLRMRTMYDLEMLRETGYCHGIENYSRHLSDRAAGEPPYTLIDFFGERMLTFIDESHVTLSQLEGMLRGDRSRKKTLVDHGFRLPSAFDNRPLSRDEFFEKVGPVLFVSATPGDWELETSKRVVEQIIRPTGLIDPVVEIRAAVGQVDDLMSEIEKRVVKGERVLVTTLTKKMSETLSEYLAEMGVKSRYLHSEIGTIERVEILRDLRAGVFDALVGINLLREGLDLPEVSLVAILDADKQGFLRSRRSLVQTMGRASRNATGMVILYAHETSDAMRSAIEETRRKRERQVAYNEEHGIEPATIQKDVRDMLDAAMDVGATSSDDSLERARGMSPHKLQRLLLNMEDEMRLLAEELRFEEAGRLRDEIKRISEELLPDE